MKTNPDDRINPIYEGHDGDYGTNEGGLTKREYFAAMAMQGAIAASTTADGGFYNPDENNISKIAVRHADALIAELNK